MSAQAPESSRISISEEKLRAIMAEFKLELVEEFAKKASQALVIEIDRRVYALELWKAAIGGEDKKGAETSAKWLALLGIAAALLGSIATIAWLHAGS